MPEKLSTPTLVALEFRRLGWSFESAQNGFLPMSSTMTTAGRTIWIPVMKPITTQNSENVRNEMAYRSMRMNRPASASML